MATLRDRLRTLHPGASGRSLKLWLEAGRVRVNGIVVRWGDTPLSAADRVELGAPPPPPFPAPLRLVHADEPGSRSWWSAVSAIIASASACR